MLLISHFLERNHGSRVIYHLTSTMEELVKGQCLAEEVILNGDWV